MRAEGTWTYVFGDLTPDSGPDILLAAGLLAASGDGLMPWRGRPDAFKRGMVARIPPVPDLKDAAE
jgi:predicted metal-binding protein